MAVESAETPTPAVELIGWLMTRRCLGCRQLIAGGSYCDACRPRNAARSGVKCPAG